MLTDGIVLRRSAELHNFTLLNKLHKEQLLLTLSDNDILIDTSFGILDNISLWCLQLNQT